MNGTAFYQDILGKSFRQEGTITFKGNQGVKFAEWKEKKCVCCRWKRTGQRGKNVVELVHAKKVYEIKGGTAVTAFKDINITIKKGELNSVRGPSGCGKSTLLNLIGALDVPSSGSVMIDGKDTKKMSSSELARNTCEVSDLYSNISI